MTAKRDNQPAESSFGPEPDQGVSLPGFKAEGIFLPSQLTQRG